jgi:hypothetical protein
MIGGAPWTAGLCSCLSLPIKAWYVAITWRLFGLR